MKRDIKMHAEYLFTGVILKLWCGIPHFSRAIPPYVGWKSLRLWKQSQRSTGSDLSCFSDRHRLQSPLHLSIVLGVRTDSSSMQLQLLWQLWKTVDYLDPLGWEFPCEQNEHELYLNSSATWREEGPSFTQGWAEQTRFFTNSSLPCL